MVQRYRLDVLKISALDWSLAETSLDILGCLNPKDVTSSVLLSVYIHAEKDSIVEILSKMDSVTVHDGPIPPGSAVIKQTMSFWREGVGNVSHNNLLWCHRLFFKDV